MLFSEPYFNKFCKQSQRTLHVFIWATSWETLFMPYMNNKGADQPAHPRSLISTFVARCLDSIIPLVSTSEISSLYLASANAQAGLSLPCLQTPKTDFLVTGPYIWIPEPLQNIGSFNVTACIGYILAKPWIPSRHFAFISSLYNLYICDCMWNGLDN